ncbi:MAG: YbbR-like domain-containing protein [Oscillospiraceae bacterium]
MKKKSKRGIFDDRRVVLLVALLLAILSWIIVAGFINPGDNRKLTYVTIDYTHNEDYYKRQNLKIVGEPTYIFADVQVNGDGADIGPLTPTSVTVYPDYSTVTGPGQHELRLGYDKVEQGEYTISDVSVRGGGHSLESSPQQTVLLTFEALETKSLPITPKADGVVADEGFFRNPLLAVPSEVVLNGPKTEIERVAQVVAEVTDEEALSERKVYTGIPLTLLDANGNELDKDTLSLSYSVEQVEVDVPISEVRTIAITADFTGLPSNVDREWFYDRVHLSTESLQVVGSTATLDHIDDPLSVATFDASTLEPGWQSLPVTIELPEGVELSNHDQLRQVTASFDTTGMVEKVFEVPTGSIVVRNGPRGATITPVADTVSVKLFGTEEQMNAVLPENIRIEIEAYGVAAGKGGQLELPARVLVPGFDQVIPLGSYSIICDVAAS